jgi:hypothetical protein
MPSTTKAALAKIDIFASKTPKAILWWGIEGKQSNSLSKELAAL